VCVCKSETNREGSLDAFSSLADRIGSRACMDESTGKVLMGYLNILQISVFI